MGKSKPKKLTRAKTNEELLEELKLEKEEIEEENATLKQQNAKLEKALKLTEKQIAKSTIQDYLEAIFDIKLGNKILTDFIIDEDRGEFITVGRPNVIGSSKSQMRHVTPYSFIEKLIDSKIKNSHNNFLIENIGSSLKILINSQEGLCLSNKDNAGTLEELDLDNDRLFSRSLSTNNDTYYFVNKNSEEYEQVISALSDNDYDIEHAKTLYKTKSKKLIGAALNVLDNSITDSNTKAIAVEQLTRIIFTLFNQRKNAAFPEEGNTFNSEIRLYDSKNDARNPNGKAYSLLTHNDLVQQVEDNQNLSQKIRIVDNEGSVVKHSFKALSDLSNLMKMKKLNASELSKYNAKYKADQFSFKLQKCYKAKLTEDNFNINCSYHVAKYLYNMFDFKPLESEVLVVCKAPKDSQIKAYKSAQGKNLTDFCIMDGNDYRASQIKLEMTKESKQRKYNKQVGFRPESGSQEEYDSLINLAIEHVLIAKETFSSFDKYNVSKKFYQLLYDQYNYRDLLNDLVRTEKDNVEKKTNSVTDSITDSITDSVVEPDITTIGDVSLMELLSI